MQPINTTDQFKETIQSDQPVIVKFEAGWLLIVKLWICGLIQ